MSKTNVKPGERTNESNVSTKNMESNNPYQMNPDERYVWMWKEMLGYEVQPLPQITKIPISKMMQRLTQCPESAQHLVLPEPNSPQENLNTLKSKFRLSMSCMDIEEVRNWQGEICQYGFRLAPIDIYIGEDDDIYSEMGIMNACVIKPENDKASIFEEFEVEKTYFANHFHTDNPKYQQMWFARNVKIDDLEFVPRKVQNRVESKNPIRRLLHRFNTEESTVVDILSKIPFKLRTFRWNDDPPRKVISAQPTLEVFEKYGDPEYAKIMDNVYARILAQLPSITSYALFGGFEYNMWNKRLNTMERYIDCITPIMVRNISTKPQND